MTEKFDYRFFFDQALQMIKSTRQTKAECAELADFDWDVIVENKLFDFLDRDYDKYSLVLNAAQIHSVESIMYIFMKLLITNGYKAKLEKVNLRNVLFSILDEDKRVLYLFHDVKSVEDSVGKSISLENVDEINEIMRKIGAESYKYIYFMKDKAYYLDVTYKHSESDSTHGTNLYSIKCFFETYFGREEYENFTRELAIYIQEVKEALGYILVKSLTPNVLVNFMKVTENKIRGYCYSDILKEKIIRQSNGKEFELPEDDYILMAKQFLDKHYYKVLVGKSDFSESLMTAVWLYDSMLKARAVDLTMIGMGYFKTVEQILYELICLRQIDNSIGRDANLGTMATYVKDHMQIFRRDLSWKAKDYVREAIYSVAKLRNDYFHRHNIHSEEKIDEIKKATFNLLFLLLGACELSDADLKTLKIPEEKVYSDYYRLCRYIDYHSGDLFFLQSKDGKEIRGTACYDLKVKIEDGDMVYSGIYIKELNQPRRVFIINETNLPFSIYLGKIDILESNAEQVRLSRTKKVFEDGIFTVEEDDYNNY